MYTQQSKYGSKYISLSEGSSISWSDYLNFETSMVGKNNDGANVRLLVKSSNE